MKISYIVPCYNVSDYIVRCIESIYEQNLDSNDFEVIAINDGSTDDTLTKLKEMSYDNLVILDQNNKGLSDARNAGVNKARGKYVWFVDSDDYLKQDTSKTVLSLAEKDDLDILVFGLNKLAGGTSLNLIHEEVPLNVVLTGADAVISGYLPNSVCGSIYNREFLETHKLRFLSKLYHEDVQFNYRAVALASRIRFIDFVPYVYEIRPNSISTSKDRYKVIKRLTDNALISESFISFSEGMKNKLLKKKIISHSRSIALGTITELLLNPNYRKKDIRSAVIAYFREHKLFPLISPTRNIKQMTLTFFLNLVFRTILR